MTRQIARAYISSIGIKKKRIIENCRNLTKYIMNIMASWARLDRMKPKSSFSL
jgi:predicted small secreted protein